MARKPRFEDVNYYSSLFLTPTASDEEIKTAHKKLQKWLHPDTKNNDSFATSCFQRVQEAYNVLGDTNKRKFYDEFRSQSMVPETKAESPKPGAQKKEKTPPDYKKSRVVFPYPVWIDLERRAVPDTRTGEKLCDGDMLNIFAEDSGLNFLVMFCVKTALDPQAAHAAKRMLEAHDKFIIIPGFVRDCGVLRPDIERMIASYKADGTGRSLDNLFLLGNQAALYRIDPDQDFKPKKADHRHPGRFLGFNFSSRFEDWRYPATARWIKEYKNYLLEYAG